MINFAEISEELHNIIKNDAQVDDYFSYITRGEMVNQDPGSTPWLGVYRKSIDYDPHTIGSNRPWKAEVQLTVLVQAASLRNGEDAEIRLEEGVQRVISAINNNKNLNDKVLMLTAINVEYAYNPEMSEDMAYQMGEITLTYEVRS